MYDTLNIKDRAMIELRYLGRTNEEIAEVVGYAKESVSRALGPNGRLFEAYTQYTLDMNKKRTEETEKRLVASDEEVYTITTNVMRLFGQKLQKKKVPLVTEDGKAVVDSDGNVKMVEIDPQEGLNASDFQRMWQIQRVMRNLPTNYEKEEVRTTVVNHEQIIKELGLTDDDFTNERREDTQRRIAEYVQRNYGSY